MPTEYKSAFFTWQQEAARGAGAGGSDSGVGPAGGGWSDGGGWLDGGGWSDGGGWLQGPAHSLESARREFSFWPSALSSLS